MKRALVLYVPVLHAGYLKLFEKYRESADALYILADDIVAELAPFHREIRAIGAAQMKPLIESLNIFPAVFIFSATTAKDLQEVEVVTADDETCRKALTHYLPENKIVYENVFLRWDEKNVKSSTEVQYDRVSTAPFDQKMCAAAAQAAEKSSDWWRHVGAVVVKDGAVVAEGKTTTFPPTTRPMRTAILAML